MLIVDAQVHIWTSGKPTNPSHDRSPSSSKDDLLKEMDEAGVDAAVIHPPLGSQRERARDRGRTAHPDRLAILGNFPLDRPESRALFDGWKSGRGCWACASRSCSRVRRLADGRHHGLAVAGGRERRDPDRAEAADSAEGRPDRGAASRARLIIDHLGGPRGRRTTQPGRPARAARAREAPERRDQGHRRAELLERSLSLPQHPRASEADLRRLRPRAHVLGHRHHAHAVLVAAVRDDVHRGAAVAVGARQGAGDGPRALCDGLAGSWRARAIIRSPDLLAAGATVGSSGRGPWRSGC